MHTSLTLFAGGLLLLAAAPAGAQPLRAVYEVHAVGMTVMEVEAQIEVLPDSYRMRIALRTRGLADTFLPGEQQARVEGGWNGAMARPAAYHSEGTWRGQERRISLDWTGGNPRVRLMQPPDDGEREVVPEAARLGTIDSLSAVALLSRTVARTGACDGAAPVFDGRRRSDFTTQTVRRELIRPWRTAWHGEALRCRYEGRLVAGFPHDRPREAAGRPQQGEVWIAAPWPGAPPIPVRIEMPHRWFGTSTAVLMSVAPSGPAQPRQ